jgi:hypothetical protein
LAGTKKVFYTTEETGRSVSSMMPRGGFLHGQDSVVLQVCQGSQVYPDDPDSLVRQDDLDMVDGLTFPLKTFSIDRPLQSIRSPAPSCTDFPVANSSPPVAIDGVGLYQGENCYSTILCATQGDRAGA